MDIKRKELKNVLDFVNAGRMCGSVVEKPQHFIFEGSSISIHNDFISVIVSFDTGIEGAVNADLLLNILKKVEDDVLELSEESSLIKIKGKNINIGINKEECSKTITHDVEKIKKWITLSDDVLNGIKLTLFSVSKNIDQGPLIGIYCNKNKIISCDNFRASVYKLDTPIRNKLIIPYYVVKLLDKYKICEYYEDDIWIHFKNDTGLFLSCRKFVDFYPNTKDIFKIDGISMELPSEFVEIVDRVGVFSDNKNKQCNVVNIEISNNRLICKVNNDLGWIEEGIDIDINIDKNISFYVSPKYLRDLLNQFKNENIKCTIGDNKILFSCSNSEHVICLFHEDMYT